MLFRSTFYMLSENFVCPNMKKTSVEDVENCLISMETSIEIDSETMEKASQSLFRMFEV